MSELPHEVPHDESLARECLANERTLLSWCRTGMNATGIGILLYFFVGIVDGLPDFARLASAVNIESRGEEFEVIGILLVVFGAVVQAVAVGRFLQYRRLLTRGGSTSSVGVYVLVVFGFLLLGLAYIGYVVVSGR